MDTHLTFGAILALVSITKGTQLLGSYNLLPSTFPEGPHPFGSPLSRFAYTGIVSAPIHEDIAHPAVVENSLAESQLPSDLLNPFYKNPHVASALAKESWFGHREFPVRNREAEKIPRSEIYKIISRLH